MRRLILLISFALLMTGCSTVPTEISRPETTEISFPPIGQVHEAYVGDSMVSQGVRETQNAVAFSQDIDIDFRWTISGLVQFVETGKSKDGVFYTSREPQGVAVKNAPGFATSNAILIKNSGAVCIITFTNREFCLGAAISPEPIMSKVDTLSDRTFQQTLLYSGKIGSQVNIGYREFSGNTARPAFSNDVAYDLKESNVVGYKGALVEVIDADNMKIQYKVLRNFNTAK